MDADFELFELVHDNKILPDFNWNGNNNIFEKLLLNNVLIENRGRRNMRRAHERDRCLVCMKRDIIYKFMPCEHPVYCQNCMEILEALNEAEDNVLRCPLCRRIPEEIYRIR